MKKYIWLGAVLLAAVVAGVLRDRLYRKNGIDWADRGFELFFHSPDYGPDFRRILAESVFLALGVAAVCQLIWRDGVFSCAAGAAILAFLSVQAIIDVKKWNQNQKGGALHEQNDRKDL